jgi:flagellar motor switch protein FliG
LAIQKLLRETDRKDLLTALKGSSEHVVRRFIDNIAVAIDKRLR